MWLAGVPIPTRPDLWLVQPTGRRHTVPPEIKRALAQAAIEYVVWLDAKAIEQAIEQGRRHGPPITRPSTDQVLAWSRRRAPAVTLRRKANSAARTPAQRAWEERVGRVENAWKTRCYRLRPFLFFSAGGETTCCHFNCYRSSCAIGAFRSEVANLQVSLTAVGSGTLRLNLGRSRSFGARSGPPHALE
jgi:hypothetical protein